MSVTHYWTQLLRLCHDEIWRQACERRLKAGSQAFIRRNRDSLRPTWVGAATVGLRTATLVVLSGIIATWATLHHHGLIALVAEIGWAAGMYGAFSLLHDTLHNSLTPSTSFNRHLGQWLASLLWLDFEGFQSSHLLHHRHSQSGHDPKRLGMGDVHVDGPLLFGPIRNYPPLLRGWMRIALAVRPAPAWIRIPFYALSMLTLAPAFIVLVGGEFSVVRRAWSTSGPWKSLARTAALYGALGWLSPLVALELALAVGLSYVGVFLVFMTHLGPAQYYTQTPIFNSRLAALNVSDIHLGPGLRWVGHGMTEYHTAHHLLPHVPCYALPSVSSWLEAHFGDIKAPAIQLTTAPLLDIADALVAFGGLPKHIGWRHWSTPLGDLFQRIIPGDCVIHSDASTTPRVVHRDRIKPF